MMYVAAWLVWPFIVVGWAFGLGFAMYGTAWLWWRGIDLWIRWHKMKPDLIVAYRDIVLKRKVEQRGAPCGAGKEYGMLDTTLRELWWMARTLVRRWRYRLWPGKDSGEPEMRIVNLDDKLASLTFNASSFQVWHWVERQPMPEANAPRSAEREE